MKHALIPAGLFALAMTCALTVDCNATNTQVAQTEADAFKLAGCILSQVFGGITDPAAIGQQCIGALPAVIVDVIQDFEAKPVNDAGLSGASLRSPDLAWLESAKRNALAAQAR